MYSAVLIALLSWPLPTEGEELAYGYSERGREGGLEEQLIRKVWNPGRSGY